ncbi:MAG: ABC transporter, partial [Lachnospiraceae bacterium]|nr:ABC transporter [Lachnospiraceae bacterium]
KGTEDLVKPLMEELEDVKELSLEGDGEFVTVTVTSDSQVDLREDIFFSCARAGLPIYEMSNVTRNLEDIFLELTRSEEMDAAEETSEERPMEEEIKEESGENADVSNL